MVHKKIVIIAGEDSGDLHGAQLIKALKQSNETYEFYGIGGEKMIKQGLTPIEHIKNLNVIGLVEVLKHYPRIKMIFNKTLAFIKKIQPEKVILIDYPDGLFLIYKSLDDVLNCHFLKIFYYNNYIEYFVSVQMWFSVVNLWFSVVNLWVSVVNLWILMYEIFCCDSIDSGN